MSEFLLAVFVLFQAPFFQSPNDAERDRTLLQTQLAEGKVDCPTWHTAIGLYVKTQELSAAAPLIDELCRHCGTDPIIQEARMICLALKGDRLQAIEVGERLVRTFPDYPTAPVNPKGLIGNPRLPKKGL